MKVEYIRGYEWVHLHIYLFVYDQGLTEMVHFQSYNLFYFYATMVL